MHKLHRIWTLILAVLLLTALFACKRADSQKSGGGETTGFDMTNVSEDGTPGGWWLNSYEGGVELFSGDGAFGFRTRGADDCRLCRVVEVRPETTYVLYADIRTENVQDGQGATLSIDNYSVDGSFIYSEALFGTNDWTPVALAFRTAEGQEAVTLALRIGGYSNESSGSVWFRNVRLEETEYAPVAVQNLYPYGYADAEEERTQEDYENVFTTIFWLGAIAAIVLAFGFLYRGKLLAAVRDTNRSKYWIFPVLVVIGLIIRYILCARFKGHSTDMTDWRLWGDAILRDGPRQFYVKNWCDYPPGYMLVCGLLRGIERAFSDAPEAIRLFIYMVPAFLCDVLSGLLVLMSAKRFRIGDGLALLLAGLIVLNPAAVFLSGAWGQIDSILALLLIGAFLLFDMSREHAYLRIIAAIVYTLAVLIKWQALIFGPVFALMFIATGLWTWDPKSFRKHLGLSFAALGAAILLIMLALLLFRGEGMPFFWMKDLFTDSATGYEYASVEGYNYLTFFGGNWAPLIARGARSALPMSAIRDLPMFADMDETAVFQKCSELFSRIALLIGFPTLILRAWNRMRMRKDGEINREFFELIFAGVLTVFLALVRYTASGYSAQSAGTRALLKWIADYPLYGVLMLGLFAYIAIRNSIRSRGFAAWIRQDGTTSAGLFTLLAAQTVFFGTWLLFVLLRAFGTALTWRTFGTIGIVTAGVVTLGLFAICLVKHIRTRTALYQNQGLIFLLAAVFMVWLFTFGHYMHERYIFPALFLLAFAYAYDRDPHKLAAFCMLTVTTFMNELVAFYVVSPGAIHAIRGGELHNRMIDLISFFEVGAALYFTAISFRKACLFHPKDPADEGLPEENEDEELPEETEDEGLPEDLADEGLPEETEDEKPAENLADEELPEEPESEGLPETVVPVGGEPDAQ